MKSSRSQLSNGVFFKFFRHRGEECGLRKDFLALGGFKLAKYELQNRDETHLAHTISQSHQTFTQKQKMAFVSELNKRLASEKKRSLQ